MIAIFFGNLIVNFKGTIINEKSITNNPLFLVVTVLIYLLNLESKIAVKPETKYLQKNNNYKSNELYCGKIYNTQSSTDKTQMCIKIDEFLKSRGHR